MSNEDLSKEVTTEVDNKCENGYNSAVHEIERPHTETPHPVHDSEDEHFEEARSEKHVDDDEKQKENEIIEEGEEYVVEPDDEPPEPVEEPVIVKEAAKEKVNADDKEENVDEVDLELLQRNEEEYQNEYENEGSSGGRVVSNAIHSMNSSAKDGYGAVISELTALTMRDNGKKVIPPKTVENHPTPSQAYVHLQNQSESVLTKPEWFSSSEQTKPNVAPPPPAYERPQQHIYNVMAATPSVTNVAPPPKFTTTVPYIGSHVIPSETGPSLTVLLRRPTSERQWGFSFYGGAEFGCPPFVNRVTKNGLAYQQGMEVGDVIVSICRTLTVGKTHEQLKAEILRAGNDLDLVLIRKGVDLEKLGQIVPQVFQNVTKSPPSSVTYGSTECMQTDSSRTRSAQSLTRGRSFRSVKTKSIRILEEQLASGQNPSSVVATKQHFQGARGLPSNGSMSTYTTAYGQNPNQGYSGRQVIIHPTSAGRVNASPNYANSYNQPYTVQPSYEPYAPASYTDANIVRSRTTWETRSDFGASGASSGGWSAAASPYGQQTYYSPSQISPSYAHTGTHHATSSITVPMHGRQNWQTHYM